MRMGGSVRLNCEHECVRIGGRMSLGVGIPRADMCQRLCSSGWHSIWDIAMPVGSRDIAMPSVNTTLLGQLIDSGDSLYGAFIKDFKVKLYLVS